MNKSVYVCYMANDRDLKGVLINNYQLKKLNSKYNLVCLVTKLVTKESISILQRFNIFCININFYKHLTMFKIDKIKIDYLFNQFYFGKLFIFLMTQYEKIIYLDTDLLIVKNIDHLFEKDIHKNTIIMTRDTLLTNNKNNHFNILKTVNTFSSGVIIFKPNYSFFQKACSLINNKKIDGIKKWYGDQGIFNELYKQNKINVDIMEYKYNAVSGVLDFYINNNLLKEDNIYIIHFGLNPKPWGNVVSRMVYGNVEKKYLLKWLNCYNNFVKENLSLQDIKYDEIIYEEQLLKKNNKKDKEDTNCKLIIKPTHGLANRLRFIASSYIFANQNNFKLFVYWEKNELCSLNYEDLFNKGFLKNISEEDFINYTKNEKIYKSEYSHVNSKINFIKENKSNYEGFIIYGGHEFYDNNNKTQFLSEKHNFYKLMNENLNEEIKRNLNLVLQDLPKEYISVHFRDYIKKYDETDCINGTFVDFSPIEKFFKLIEQLENEYKNIPLLILSNNNEIYKKFQIKYPTKKILYLTNGNNNIYEERNTKSNMIKSVIEFLLLSRSKLIIGSYSSSFSDEAIYFNNIKKIIPLSDNLSLKLKKSYYNYYHCLGFNYDNIKDCGILNIIK